MQTPVKWTEFRIQELLTMLSYGMTIAQIASHFNVSKTRIYHILHKRHINPDAYRPASRKFRKFGRPRKKSVDKTPEMC